MAAERFPQDVQELQAFLGEESLIPGVRATPGQGTHVPLYILGSSLFGAQLAAVLGLPYGFASHFAPQALHDAVRVYRERFEPSEQLDRPYVIAGVNVIAADTEDEARRHLEITRRARVRSLFGRGDRRLSDEEVDAILRSPRALAVDEMMRYTAVGTPDTVVAYLDEFRRSCGADELITVHATATVPARLRSVELLAEAAGLEPGDRAEPVPGVGAPG